MVPNSLRAAVIAAAMASAACSGSIAGTTADTPAVTAAQTQIAPAPGRYAAALPDFASLAEHYGPAVVNVTIVGKRQNVSDVPNGMDELRAAAKKRNGKVVALLIERDNAQIFVPVRVG